MSRTYRRAQGAVDATVDDQVVLLSPIDFSYHSLDRVGGRVWALLEQPSSADALVAALTVDFDVSPDQCRTDLEPFLEKMVSIGVLEVVPDH